jgi:hypothetical protein
LTGGELGSEAKSEKLLNARIEFFDVDAVKLVAARMCPGVQAFN